MRSAAVDEKLVRKRIVESVRPAGRKLEHWHAMRAADGGFSSLGWRDSGGGGVPGSDGWKCIKLLVHGREKAVRTGNDL